MTLLLRAPVVAPEPEKKKTRPKIRVKVRSRFDRAGGAVEGEMIIDRDTGVITVHEKNAKVSYSLSAADVCEYIARRNMGLAR